MALSELIDFIRILFRSRRYQVVWAFLITLALGVFEGVGIVMVLPLLQLVGLGSGLGNNGISAKLNTLFAHLGVHPSLGIVLTLFCLVVWSRAALTYTQGILFHHLQSEFVHDLRLKLYKSILHSRWSFFLENKTADFMQVLTNDLGRITVGTHFLIRISSSSVFALAYLALAFSFSPGMTLATGTSALVLLLVLRRSRRDASKTGKLSTESSKLFFNAIQEHLQGMKVAKSFGAEDRHFAHFSRISKELLGLAHSFLHANNQSKLIFDVGAVVILSLFLFVSVEIFQLEATALVVLVLTFARLLPRVSDLQASWQQVAHMIPAFVSYKEMQRRCEAASEAEESETPIALELRHELSFHNLSFGYRNRENRWALEALNLSIPARKTTAIVGASGAGKSTMANLLLGLLEPSEGHICIDGKELEASMLRRWRRQVGYVPQETYLFHESIKDNLLWAAPHVSDQELRAALEQAAAWGFVSQLEMGWDTVIGERGVMLSGGERQRLALARALLVKPRLLVLDEATSALDGENERRIQEAIEQLHGETTVVVIAHRLSTIRNADQLLVMEKGRVVESGKWDELAQRPGGLFAEMLAGQR